MSRPAGLNRAETLFTLVEDGDAVVILDQTLLPGRAEYRRLSQLDEAAHAIRAMQVRGAPLIGATAASRSPSATA